MRHLSERSELPGRVRRSMRGSGRVEHPISYLDGIAYNSFRLIHRNLIDTESDSRHHYAIVQSYIFHILRVLISDAKLRRDSRSVIT